MTTTSTPDRAVALAAELGRIGRRLDGMGVELLTLRGGAPGSPDGEPSAGAGATPMTSGSTAASDDATPSGGFRVRRSVSKPLRRVGLRRLRQTA